jgi:hypothetical protein
VTTVSSEAVKWLEDHTFPLCEIADRWESSSTPELEYFQSVGALEGGVIDAVEITVSPFCRPMFEVVSDVKYMPEGYYLIGPGCPCEDLSRTSKCATHPDPSPQQLAEWLNREPESDHYVGFRAPDELMQAISSRMEEALGDIGAA